MEHNIDYYKIKLKNLNTIKITMFFVLPIFFIIILTKRTADAISFIENFSNVEEVTILDLFYYFISDYALLIILPIIILFELISILLVVFFIFVRAKKYYQECINNLSNKDNIVIDASREKIIKECKNKICTNNKINQIINEIGFIIWILLFFLSIWIISIVLMTIILFINIYFIWRNDSLNHRIDIAKTNIVIK